jgi:cell filamentation protein
LGRKYKASGIEAEFEPGSRGHVLRNKLGIRNVRDMNRAEWQAYLVAQNLAAPMATRHKRFGAADICALHRLWLGHIYPWAGEYRRLNIGKGGFQFAHAQLIPALMLELERGPLAQYTPCRSTPPERTARALAVVHGELILIHPFREGNGRVARLLSLLMGLQAGLPALDFAPLDGSRRQDYIAAIHACMSRNYVPLSGVFEKIIDVTLKRYDASSTSPRTRSPERALAGHRARKDAGCPPRQTRSSRR